MTKTRVKSSVGVAALVAAGLMIAAAPASATSAGPRDTPRFGDTVDRKQVRDHDRVRKQQVRQTQGQSKERAFFGPLYEGRDSPWQRMKRAFD
ncbi:hypothetical protein EV667_4399 [Ancylobacter aquaticus]|uniref:Uncharacterized protein n=1 Tax=Ancylobacter aquaticus TaxID=100 RepID=A0A4R1HBR9_ANCAQ|nr:hypothetical protein [Ancylobacter aquaticus]TCK16629.1 hypothetical protein EV667_4399 [Ancylobacter aquaticus]